MPSARPVLCVLLLVLPCARAQVVNYKTFGLDFGPWVAGQDPRQLPFPQVSETNLRQRMQIVAPYTRWIRTYSTQNGL